MIITIKSNKFGVKDFLIDEIDFERFKDYSFYLWSTPRHYGIYVNCYSPWDRNRPQRLHRLIMSAEKNQIVDHINGNPLDNRKENLRLVTSTINNQNARKRKDGLTSRFKGVSWCKMSNKWKAQIQVNGKKMGLGSYAIEELAAAAYNNALDSFAVLSPRNIIYLK